MNFAEKKYFLDFRLIDANILVNSGFLLERDCVVSLREEHALCNPPFLRKQRAIWKALIFQWKTSGKRERVRIYPGILRL
jgi:hypothetical protein